MRWSAPFWLLLRLALPAGLAAWLLTQLSPWPAFGAAAGIGLAASLVGAGLLVKASVGGISWRNYAAGWLMPFASLAGQQSLLRIALGSAAVFAVVAGYVVLSLAHAGEDAAAGPASGVAWLLVLAWIVDSACLHHLLVSLRTYQRFSSPWRALARLAVMVTAIVGVSLGLLLSGHPSAALWVAGGPPLAIGVGYGLFALAMVTMGRHSRWN